MKSTLAAAARGICVVSAAFAFLGGAPQRASCADREYKLEDITARLNEWQSQIVTLRMKTRDEFDPQSKRARDSHVAGVERVGFEDWIWTDTGAIRGHRWADGDARVGSRAMGVAGTQRDWIAVFLNGASDEGKPVQVTFQAGESNLTNLTNLTPLYGLWSRDRPQMWLNQRIADKKLRLVDTVELDGYRCPVLQTDGEPPYSQRLWLDPDHDFLPMQVEGPGGFKYVVEEFFEPRPGLHFPKQGYFLHRKNGEITETNKWEVLSVEVNEPIPAALWEPPLADGTEVVNVASNARYVHGGKSYKPGIAGEIADEARETVRGTPVQASSPAITGFWWAACLVVMAVALLLGAVVVRRAR